MKQELFQDVIAKLKGAGVLSSLEEELNLGQISTGSYAFNKVLSGKFSGGFPIGGISEIYGESSTGKSVFLTHAFAEAQKHGYWTIMVDNEFSYSSEFAKAMGVDSDKLIYTTPETLEECFQQIEDIVKQIRDKDKETPILVGLDSIGTVSTQAELEEDMVTQNNMAGAIRAKAMGRALRKINPTLRKNKVALILINQVRSKVGVMYGDPLTKAGGGKSLEFYCTTSTQILSNKTDNIIKDDNKTPIGIEGKLRNKKNKQSLPFRETTFRLIFDKGLDPYEGLLDCFVQDNLITQSGAWYTVVENNKKFQSKDFIALLNEDANFEHLRKMIHE